MMRDKSNTALYMRLSREDGETLMSASIENQRKILRNYAHDNGFSVFDEYIDDGYTGTNFERPAFKRLAGDITNGLVGVVITKDFSRLGRNTGQVMTILDDFFVRNNVRYISITEGIDTLSSNITGLLAPMLSFTNELYSGDISRKINASFSAKMKEGEFIGAFAPYGYKKDEENKNHLIPDKEASDVVKRVFALAKNGYSPRQIAEILNDDGFLTPSEYRLKSHANLDKQNCAIIEKWKTNTVSRLLRNEVYLGHMLQGKTHKPSFKSSYIASIPKSEWICVKNTHEPLVDSDTWDIVRKRTQSRTQLRDKGFVNLFSGIAKCSDCGRNMSTVGAHKKAGKANLNCGGYKQYGKKACFSHLIDYGALYNIISEVLRKQICFTEAEREELLCDILKSEISDTSKIDDARKKLSVVSEKLVMLYDKRFSGDIDDITFKSLKKRYEFETKELRKFIKREEDVMLSKRSPDEERLYLKKIVEDFENVKCLESDLIFKLIDRIDVHNAKYIGKTKHQRIDIHFKFNCEADKISITQ